jgi:hypothetical protein
MVTTGGSRHPYTYRGVAVGGVLSAVAVATFFVTGEGLWLIVAGIPTAVGLVLGAIADRRTDAPRSR